MNVTHHEIVDYWSKHENECRLSVDWAEAEKLCWRCSQKRALQRCHIIPKALGGNEEPSNLVLLCGQCHAEAPNVLDPEFMWVWLRAHAVTYYGTYWLGRGLREYELIYGRRPFVDLEDPERFLGKAKDVIEEILRKASTHWGQGKLNPATWAWVIRQVELKSV